LTWPPPTDISPLSALTRLGIIKKPDRTPAEDQAMIHLNQASLYHWSQREDCTNRNYSIGYWQAARIYALVGQVDNARRYGELCLHCSQDAGDFLLGYAYEALAREESVAGEVDKADKYLQDARRCLAQISDPGEREQLAEDLESIKAK